MGRGGGGGNGGREREGGGNRGERAHVFSLSCSSAFLICFILGVLEEINMCQLELVEQ